MSVPEFFTSIKSDPALKRVYDTYSEGSLKLAFDEFSAMEDNAEAVYCLAFMYLNGKGVVKNVKKAFELFGKSSEMGFLPATSDLAQCHAYGIGTKEDDDTAFALFMKAAEAGDPYAMSMVSLMYHDGSGVKKNHKEANAWSEKCDESCDIDEVEEEGLCYAESGNYILARLFLMRSGVMGSPVSCKALAFMYSFGEGVAVDDAEFSDWEDTAIDCGWDDVELGDLGDHEEWFAKFFDPEELDD